MQSEMFKQMFFLKKKKKNIINTFTGTHHYHYEQDNMVIYNKEALQAIYYNLCKALLSSHVLRIKKK